MIKGQIVIKLTDGSSIIYANKYLAKKEGFNGYDAEEDPKNKMFDGFSEYSYYYTGYGCDTYENQTEAGMIKADYEYLVKQIDVAGKEYLRFPENYETKKAEVGELTNDNIGTTTLVRNTSSTINSGITKKRTSVSVSEIVSINVREEWVNYPYGRESGYNLPKSDSNFYGFQETAERKAKGVDKGPDFNAHATKWNGYIPTPTIKYNYDGTFYVIDKDLFDKVEVRNGSLCGVIYTEYNDAKKARKSAPLYVSGKMVDGPKEKPVEVLPEEPEIPPKKPEVPPKKPEVPPEEKSVETKKAATLKKTSKKTEPVKEPEVIPAAKTKEEALDIKEEVIEEAPVVTKKEEDKKVTVKE